MIIFYIVYTIVIIQRLGELFIARKNEQWLKKRGGIEVGERHYPLFIIIHACFFLSFMIEVHTTEQYFIQSLFVFFLLLQIGRIWCIISLGRFWNTKVIVVPNVIRIKRGPYKWCKHPNYTIVLLEILTLPLMFGAIKTALIFVSFQLILIFIRIPCEERALRGEF
ncbi:MAG TPA: isoprenylcysteine carboxylmethyltransferase family protein [Pseudogracilibacillus sp.]|nr:isoprenylcysteine carboxylmethyltransferase family protein [Pseudogracilibacillus sp.]